MDDLRAHGVEVTLLPASNVAARTDLPHPGVPHQVRRHRTVGGARFVLPHPFDVVHVESFYMLQHAPSARGSTMLVEQNVESELWAQRARTETEPRRRRWYRHEARAAAAAERAAWRSVDLIGAVTAEDRAQIARRERHRRVVLVPNGMDHRSVEDAGDEVGDLPPRPRVALVANFAYEPNVDAATYLVGEILPRLHALGHHPSVLLVGNEPPEAVRRLAQQPGVTVTGRVRAVEPYLDAADVVACPLRVGGGLKVKVLEALRRGCATVTTSVGAQGFDESATAALRIADDPGAFAAEVAGLLADPAARRRLGEAAALAAPRHGSWDDAAQTLLRHWRSLAERPVAAPARVPSRARARARVRPSASARARPAS
jgi:glycosyltransferase involved in cell wall biosynthesis